MAIQTFNMSDSLKDFDIFPKVFVAGKKSEIHIRPLWQMHDFCPDVEYVIEICGMDGSLASVYPESAYLQEFVTTTDNHGCFCFEYCFPSEQAYFIRVFHADKAKFITEFEVYCVEQDLAGRYPFLGDLHVHTNGSDGKQSPEVACADYRKHGYDFMAITDHHHYYPSLRACTFYKDVPTELVIVPGEEVHVGWVHIVNFGGEYSVNCLVEGAVRKPYEYELENRSIRGADVPNVMHNEEFEENMHKLSEEMTLPEGVNPYQAAICKWVFEKIKDANGLGIFAHPNWIYLSTYYVPEVFSDWLMESKLADAFEVLGGERYYEQNGFQTARYYEQYAKGNRIPVVGSTDSHDSSENSPKALVASTIVFSPKNERTELIASIKDFYSVAVDTISSEYRLVGERRLIRYASFLIKNYFPLHDELCYEEGRLMKQYATGIEEEKEEALKCLNVIHGRVQKQREKYFDFSVTYEG